jgi:hypothetical protein
MDLKGRPYAPKKTGGGEEEGEGGGRSITDNVITRQRSSGLPARHDTILQRDRSQRYCTGCVEEDAAVDARLATTGTLDVEKRREDS